jgi:hypothetical protein
LACISRIVGAREGEERSGGYPQRDSNLKKNLKDMECNADIEFPRIPLKDDVAYADIP